MNNDHKYSFDDCFREFTPEFIMHEGIKYKFYACLLLSGKTVSVAYGEFDGNSYNWDKQLLSHHYCVCDAIPETPEYSESDLRDATIYVLNIEDAVNNFNEKLNNLDYEILEEIVIIDVEFRRELTSLLNRYSKENESNTPDFILANHLISCLKSFNEMVNYRDKFHKLKR